MSVRALRDGLERLQGERGRLEAELAAKHDSGFLQAREEGRQVLALESAALDTAQRSAQAAADAEATARNDVERLEAELRAVEQRRLPVATLVLLVVAFALVWPLLSNDPTLGPAAFTSALGLGLLFGSRLAAWARPSERREPLAPNLFRFAVGDVWRNPGALALGCSALATMGSALLVVSCWAEWNHWEYRDWGAAHFFTAQPAQLLAIAGALLAVRARTRAHGDAGRRTITAALMLGLGVLGVSALTWVPDLVRMLPELRWYSPQWLLVASCFPLSAAVPLIALGLAQSPSHAGRRSRLAGSLALSGLSLFACGVVWAVPSWSGAPLSAVAVLWTALQACGGGLLLGTRYARAQPEPQTWRQWAGTIAGAGALSLLIAAAEVMAGRW